MKTRVCGLMFALIGTLPLAAQSAVADKVASALDRDFVEPDCNLPGGGDFRVKSVRLYLVTGIKGTGAEENKARALRDGVRVGTEAITQSGQAKNPAAWYYLGRVYLQQGDLVGADTAFTRAEALAPQCKADIRTYRYRPWAALVREGVRLQKAEQPDSAMTMFRAANITLKDEPLSYYSMADIFDAQGNRDSSLLYFQRAAATQPTDPTQVKVRNNAVLNHAILLLNAGRADDAVAGFRRYQELAPDDADGKKLLARALRAAGKTDEAQAIEKDLISEAGAPGGEGLSESELYELAAKQYNDKEYEAAAATAAKAVELNPLNREALNIQANSYLGLRQWDKLGPVADKLVAIEPMSYFFQSMRAQAYRETGDKAKMAEAIIAREGLVADIDLRGGTITADGATVTGTAKGRQAMDESGKTLAPKAQTLSFEFLDKDGGVLATEDVSIPALAKDSTQPIEVHAKAEGIRGWRYKAK